MTSGNLSGMGEGKDEAMYRPVWHVYRDVDEVKWEGETAINLMWLLPGFTFGPFLPSRSPLCCLIVCLDCPRHLMRACHMVRQVGRLVGKCST